MKRENGCGLWFGVVWVAFLCVCLCVSVCVTKRTCVFPVCFLFPMQKYKEYLNGSNLIVKLQAKHDLLKQTLGEGEGEFDFPG